jgi:hypothetical protein
MPRALRALSAPLALALVAVTLDADAASLRCRVAFACRGGFADRGMTFAESRVA